jgi:AcrR family transcriptional regulator
MSETTVQPGLRERKRERTRRTIAAAALELFDRQGFHDTTIPQIAEAADVSPRTVSAYFPHKEDLLFPDAEESGRLLEQRLHDRRPGESTAEALRAFIEAWLGERAGREAEERVRHRVIRADPALRAHEHRYLSRAQETIAEAMARDLGVAATDLEPRMAAAATLTIFELLGEDLEDATDAEALAVLDRALLFIGGGLRSLGAASR